MAIGHFDLTTISRSAGRNACATAAYISSGVVVDLRTQRRFDYKKKHGTLHAEIILPDQFSISLDRQTLWATAEKSELRKDAVVARHCIVPLPHELTAGAHIELTRALAKFVANEHGVAVDFAIHAPPTDGDQRNFHAHILFTSRRANFVDSVFQLEEKTRELDVKKTSSECVKKFRAQWEKLVNDSLSSAGSEARIDLRSHAARAAERGGIVLPAKQHLGPAATAAKRRGQRPRVTRVNEQIDLERAALLDVNRELRAMAAQQSIPSSSPARRLPAPRAGNRHGPRP